MTNITQSRVLIIGGGYGGTAVAKALDAYAAVTLIEPRERFFHNIGALRAAVDAQWLDKLFIPYDHLFKHGQVLRSTVSAVAPHEVVLDDTRRLSFDYLVLATGSSYPFPAQMTVPDVASTRADMERVNDRIRGATSILLIGSGPVGIEFAGEIATAYPGKPITLLDRSPKLLQRLHPRLGQRLAADLEMLGVRLLLGEQLAHAPHRTNALASDLIHHTFTTDRGTSIETDLYFNCFGVEINSGYIRHGLSDVLNARGQVKVTSTLQVDGHPHIFAVGDMTDVPELKLAVAAGAHGAVVAENIRRLIAGRIELKHYKPLSPAVMIVPVGPRRGAAQLPLGKNGLVLGAWAASWIKGRTLLTERFWKAMGTALPHN